jgi:hypothetical protein
VRKPDDVEPFFFDSEHLTKLAATHAAAYREARPFPHVVLDGFLPDEVARALVDEFPPRDAVPWIAYDSATERKLESLDEATLGSLTRQVISQLNGGALVSFLEKLTGITGLVPDPALWGGGLHQIEPGGFLEVHADFNVHPSTGLHRRLNLLLYLNPGWQDDWGGHLELWGRDMRRCEIRVLPAFNRCVVFNTDRYCFHGHPHALTSPDGVTRKSLALYYYARDAGEGGPADVHNTMFQTRPPSEGRAGLRERARNAWRRRGHDRDAAR